MDNVYFEDSVVQAELYSIKMDDAPNGIRNEFEAAVAFLLPTNPVTKKSKDKKSVAEISAMTADENKCGERNYPRKQNSTQVRKQGGNLNSGIINLV